MKIAPSMLACDFSKMGEELKKISLAGADLIHLDVMDGLFVPNISFGPSVIKALRSHSSLPFDVHLMIENPERYINEFAIAGANIITFHIEAVKDIQKNIDIIKKEGTKVGISLKPGTPASQIFPYLNQIDIVLVMTVEPGFGGQKFMPEMLEKIKMIKQINKNVIVEVDGGINAATARQASEAGADICVAGTSVFKAENPARAISQLKGNIL